MVAGKIERPRHRNEIENQNRGWHVNMKMNEDEISRSKPETGG